jgi:AraC family transcriptional regulator, transcriptional activator of pobA
MARSSLPVYDICTISNNGHAQQDLMVERFSDYLKKHYHNLHRPHRHSFYHLVLYTKGSGSHTIDFVRFGVKPYQIYFMIPGQVHSWEFEENVDGYIIHFSHNLFRSFLQDQQYLERFQFFGGNSEDGVCQLPPAIHHDIIQLFEAILYEATNQLDASVDMIRLKLLNLFILVERSCSSERKKKLPQQKYLLLRNFQQLIDQYYRTIRLPKEYADLLYITANHLNALCQDLLGKTAGELIRDRVLLEAKRLLTNADMSITEIAYDLNFQDNSYFNRFFKKYEGMTPDEFRKQFINQ